MPHRSLDRLVKQTTTKTNNEQTKNLLGGVWDEEMKLSSKDKKFLVYGVEGA